jgi:hypothetical protein
MVPAAVRRIPPCRDVPMNSPNRAAPKTADFGTSSRIEQEVGAFREPVGGEPAGFGEFAVEVAGVG